MSRFGQAARKRLSDFSSSKKVLVSLVALIGALMALRTFQKGWDFAVFWQVSRDFLNSGSSPYDLTRYGNMVFKYPPWILPFFLPFALVPLSVAKILWGLIEAGSLAYVVFRIDQVNKDRGIYTAGAEITIQFFLLLIFGGIWIVQGIVGQTSLPMLALVLWAESLRRASLRADLISLLTLSAKVLTLFPFLARFRDLKFWKSVGIFLGLILVLSAPLWWTVYGTGGGGRLIVDWLTSNFSGTQAVNAVRIGFTTREAQGFPSLFLRIFSWDESNSRNVLASILLSVVVVGAFGFWRVRRLPESIRFWGWLALTPLVQPLAWFHFYCFAYPLLAWGLVRAHTDVGARDRRGWEKLPLWIAALLIGLVTEKTLGDFGLALEYASVKSWGVILAVTMVTAEYRTASR